MIEADGLTKLYGDFAAVSAVLCTRGVWLLALGREAPQLRRVAASVALVALLASPKWQPPLATSLATTVDRMARPDADQAAEFARVLEERSPAKQQRTLRETRMAANEAFFRALNDRLERETHEAQPLIVLCECADEDCTKRIELTRSEYEETRSDPAQFVVAPSHADPEIERVIDRTDRFEMVRKVGVGFEVATRLENSKTGP